MKTMVLIAALIAASGVMTDTSAQVSSRTSFLKNKKDNGNWFPYPHRSINPYRTLVSVSYDATSTVLTVKFQSNSQGGTVEVYHDGEKIAGITANAGTTFSCILREYGEGNYNVIVSNGNTVIDSKNFTVR